MVSFFPSIQLECCVDADCRRLARSDDIEVSEAVPYRCYMCYEAHIR